jgi:hypothetical protein
LNSLKKERKKRERKNQINKDKTGREENKKPPIICQNQRL